MLNIKYLTLLIIMSIEYCIFKLVKLLLSLKRKLAQFTFYQLLFISIVVIVFILILKKYVYTGEDTKIYSADHVILWWDSTFPGTSETRNCFDNIKCIIYSDKKISDMYHVNAYLFYGSSIKLDSMPLSRKPNDIWGLYHEESPRNVEELMHEKFLNLFNFSSTYSRYSDVPFPLQHLDNWDSLTNSKHYFNTSLKNHLLKDISPIVYLQSDCETSTERDNYVKELMKFVSIDSYGACLNNKVMPEKYQKDYLNHLDDDGFLDFIARYKFVLAIENGICRDYVTEKFWRAIKVGSVPIYFGSPSIRDWLPNENSAILLEDYPTPELLADYIRLLMDNNGLYEKHLEHKTSKVVRNVRLLDELKLRPYQKDALQTAAEFECYVCKKLHEIENSNHQTFIVDKTHYDCPKPISALSLKVNPLNDWVSSWELAGKRVENFLKTIY